MKPCKWCREPFRPIVGIQVCCCWYCGEHYAQWRRDRRARQEAAAVLFAIKREAAAILAARDAA